MASTFAQGVVAKDNVQANKAAGVQTAIKATGASLLYQTPFSLDFKPIGKALSKLKVLLRAKAQRQCRLSSTSLSQPNAEASSKPPDTIQNKPNLSQTASNRNRGLYADNERQP
jgi:hypothetical protein